MIPYEPTDEALAQMQACLDRHPEFTMLEWMDGKDLYSPTCAAYEFSRSILNTVATREQWMQSSQLIGQGENGSINSAQALIDMSSLHNDCSDGPCRPIYYHYLRQDPQGALMALLKAAYRESPPFGFPNGLTAAEREDLFQIACSAPGTDAERLARKIESRLQGLIKEGPA